MKFYKFNFNVRFRGRVKKLKQLINICKTLNVFSGCP